MTVEDFKRSYIDINGFSRTGKTRALTLGIALHGVGKANQRAHDVIDYFDSLKCQNALDDKPDISASAQIVIDTDGTPYLIMDLNEKAYHCGSSKKDPISGKIYTDLARLRLKDFASFPDKTSPNSCLIGIEMCHKEKGRFTPETIKTATEVCVFLCHLYGLTQKDLFTHQEIVGWKDCPELWTKSPALFSAFKEDVRRLL